jgi:hypothetical protein
VQDKFGLAVGFICPLFALEFKLRVGNEMEGAVGSPLSRSNVGTALFDRIVALAHEIASSGGSTPRFGQRDIGIGAKAKEVFFPCAGTAISE